MAYQGEKMREMFSFKLTEDLLRRLRRHCHLKSLQAGYDVTPSDLVRDLLKRHLSSSEL